MPKRIAQAGLSVGLVPLVLLVVAILMALGLVLLGTRRRTPDKGGH
jgi:cell division protein FtsL